MSRAGNLRSILAISVSSAAMMMAAPALAQSQPPAAATPQAETPQSQGDVIVTAERKEENILRTPIAVSAFTGQQLKIQRLDSGENLELSIPNVFYSRSNFGDFNFQIRGIGSKVVGQGGTSGVSMNVDELPLFASNFNDTDFFDVKRVEVLRGPQGTLYGRNATGGAVDVITNLPTRDPGGSISVEYGNFNETKIEAVGNMPLGDMFAARVAGYWTRNDGFGTNTYNGDRIDGRNLGSVRATLMFTPNSHFSAWLMYQHDGENDDRNLTGKQLCIKDPGPATVGGVNATNASEALTQGCLPGSLYSNAAYGTFNTSASEPGWLTNLLGLTSGDVTANHPLQDHNLHDIESTFDPKYRAQDDLVELHMDYDLGDHLKLSSITGFNAYSNQSWADYRRVVSTTPFNTSPNPVAATALGINSALYSQVYHSLFPNGVVSDPQTGASSYLNGAQYGQAQSHQVTEEVRLQSSFAGPLNFSAGAYFSDNVTPGGKTFLTIESNGLTAFAQANNAFCGLQGNLPGCGIVGGPIAIDNSSTPTGQGHNYYASVSGEDLKSYAGFGEVYYNLTPTVRLTGGVRYTVDDLRNTVYPILAESPVTPASTQQHALFSAWTGRANIDWTPTLSFTDKTLVYASYSRGYKGGGFNTPCSGCVTPTEFQPEYVNAYEIGTKNVLMHGRLMLNADAFYYDYTNYQVSEIQAQSSVNVNVDAKIYGVEFEGVWEPVHNLTLNANVGWLHTQLVGASSIDSLNLTGGNPNYTVINGSQAQKCIVDTAGVAALLSNLPSIYQNSVLGQACSPAAMNHVLASLVGPGTANAFTGPVGSPGGLLYTYGPGVLSAPGSAGAGVNQNLTGNQLPSAPQWTVSLGAQYTWDLGDAWTATLRGDYYWQSSNYARIFNGVGDYLKAWDNVNATLNFQNKPMGLTAQLWVKNAFDNQPITDIYVADPTAGLFTNTLTLDPRTFGLTLTKAF